MPLAARAPRTSSPSLWHMAPAEPPPSARRSVQAGKFYSNWDEENKVFVLQLYFKKQGVQAPRAREASLMAPGVPTAPPTG